MPRRNPRNASAAQALPAPTKAAIPGGSAGMPNIDETPNEMAAGRDDASPARQRKARRWMVVDGPRDGNGGIRFNDGYMSSLRPGKIVDESGSFNLRKMRDQGIRLEPMPDEDPPPPDLGGPVDPPLDPPKADVDPHADSSSPEDLDEDEQGQGATA